MAYGQVDAQARVSDGRHDPVGREVQLALVSGVRPGVGQAGPRVPRLSQHGLAPLVEAPVVGPRGRVLPGDAFCVRVLDGLRVRAGQLGCRAAVADHERERNGDGQRGQDEAEESRDGASSRPPGPCRMPAQGASRAVRLEVKGTACRCFCSRHAGAERSGGYRMVIRRPDFRPCGTAAARPRRPAARPSRRTWSARPRRSSACP